MDAEHPARLRVGVVGPGRVGAALAVALGRAGHEVVGRVRRVRRLGAARPRSTCPAGTAGQPPEVVEAADLVLLTVPDDVLPGLVTGLAATGRSGRGPAGRAHQRPARSGRARPGGPARRAAAGPAPGDDLHRAPRRHRHGWPASASGSPPRSRSGRWPRRWSSRWAASRCSSPRSTATSITPRWPARPTTWSPWSPRPCDLLRKAGAANPARMLGPLLYAALDNALRLGDAGLTGPVARGDADTVASHIWPRCGPRARGAARLPGAGPADRGPGARGRARSPRPTRSGCSACSAGADR